MTRMSNAWWPCCLHASAKRFCTGTVPVAQSLRGIETKREGVVRERTAWSCRANQR
jgi:hypothetical protein